MSYNRQSQREGMQDFRPPSPSCYNLYVATELYVCLSELFLLLEKEQPLHLPHLPTPKKKIPKAKL